MELNKNLDEAIRLNETSNDSSLTAGYVVNGKPYPNYVSNSSWAKFCNDMEVNHPVAYDNYKNGDGKELDERKVGQNIYPPKMASFGSSSRFIYNLMKHDKSFKFEKQLPTTVGGTANLDGFKETSDSYVFVEAKCREPYSKKNKFYGQKYFSVNYSLTNFNLIVAAFIANFSNSLLAQHGTYTAPFTMLLILAVCALGLNFSIKKP